jgi:hypothetical protein
VATFAHASTEEMRALGEVLAAGGPSAAASALSLHVYNATVTCPARGGLLPVKLPGFICDL